MNREEYEEEYDVTDFINKQLNAGHKIVFAGFSSRGAWEDCTGLIKFDNDLCISITDEVTVRDKDDNILSKEVKYDDLF